ncbi:MAG TPA: YfiR family protein [Dissulfurispiraceae bacterium]|nr:YfiR family protein [Dissulfurispiraceae bacterium]
MEQYRRHFIAIVIFAFLVTGCGVPFVFGETYKAGEYQVKAAFIYNFINFVEWPPQSSFAGSPTITLCIIGDDPFGDALRDLQNETVRGKKLTVKYRSPDDIRGCNIIFLSASDKYHASKIVRSVGKSDILTISDTEESAQRGIIISFFVEQNKVRFVINTGAAKRAGLNISAKLLKLARILDAAEGSGTSREY